MINAVAANPSVFYVNVHTGDVPAGAISDGDGLLGLVGSGLQIQ